VTAREVSAGGVVSRDGKLLLVRVKNLEKRKVWTFPKGHLDPGETALEAAIREVREETGWRCRAQGPLYTARYRFRRGKTPVSKVVKWYRMRPQRKVGRPDLDEILSARWVSVSRAEELLSYPSDLKLVSAWKRRARA
jgi:ADP-ribose pyrophosphatase YjhB (NUDIX family)